MKLISTILKLTIAFTLTANIDAFSQVLTPDSITVRFDKYRKNALVEKLYLQTDRPNYLAGETMWFKVNVTDGSFHQPLSITKVAYIEILDRFNEPVLQTKIGLQDGRGSGSVFLPATLNSGNYQLRAFTNWMKNSDEAFFFSKTITILNTFRKMETEITVSPPALDAQFFPEGGTLVSGVPTKIGFRVVNQNGMGIPFKGYLLDERNDTLAHFSPLKFGIGHFIFTPSADHSYHAVIHEPSGRKTEMKLPAISTQGYSLTVVDTTSSSISIGISARLPETATPIFYLFIHARQIIAHAEVKFLQNNRAFASINKTDLPEGISHITLFDGAMNPVCERLYFKKPENLLSIGIRTDQQRYANRRRVTLDLQSTLPSVPAAADLAVSIFKVDSLPVFEKNIAEYFWLTSDLKGAIESPEYYFSQQTPEVKQAQDNLMLTHGWRRFNWTDIMSKKTPSFIHLPEYRNHIIQGIVKGQDGKPVSGIFTYLTSPGKIIRLYGSLSNVRGEVFFEMQNFEGTTNIVAQINPKSDSTHHIEILSPFPDQKKQPSIPALIVKPSTEKALLDRSVSMQVQDIYYGEQIEKTAKPLTSADTTAFYGLPDEKYFLDAYTRFPVMEEVMREYVPGVLVRKHKDGFHFLVIDNVNRKTLNETPLVLLDGVPIFDEDEIMAFDPLKVKKLEVVTRQYFLGPLWFPGIVSYTTYTGDLNGFNLSPRAITMNYEGLQLHRELFSPRYESPKQRESRMPDQRTLLYWNPDALTDTTGKKQIEFFTSDVPGQYKIVVQGITPNGEVGSATTTFSVSEINN